MLSQRTTLLIASVCGILAVALGAFGAHALKDMLVANNRLETYELATRYHFYHTLALIGVSILMDKFPGKYIQLSATFLLLGVILFSGSLYILSLTNISKFAIVTPLGGVFMIAGWTSLLMAIVKKRASN
jgi:uncharacterized membrane protein YgdD (TMEM256/DUF423 family)